MRRWLSLPQIVCARSSTPYKLLALWLSDEVRLVSFVGMLPMSFTCYFMLFGSLSVVQALHGMSIRNRPPLRNRSIPQPSQLLPIRAHGFYSLGKYLTYKSRAFLHTHREYFILYQYFLLNLSLTPARFLSVFTVCFYPFLGVLYT